MIPFCTSGGSAFSDAIDEIRDMEPDATVLDGLHIGASSVSDAESRVNEWGQNLDYQKNRKGQTIHEIKNETQSKNGN